MWRQFQDVLLGPYTPLVLIFIASVITAVFPRFARALAILTAVFALLGGVVSNIVSNKRQASIQNTASTRSLPKATGFPLAVKLGSNISYVSQSGKVPLIEFPPTFTVEVSKELAILVSGEVRQRDGTVIGQIHPTYRSILATNTTSILT